MKEKAGKYFVILATAMLFSAPVAMAECSGRYGHSPDTGNTLVICSDGRTGEGTLAGADPAWLQQAADQYCCPGELGNPMFSSEG